MQKDVCFSLDVAMNVDSLPQARQMKIEKGNRNWPAMKKVEQEREINPSSREDVRKRRSVWAGQEGVYIGLGGGARLAHRSGQWTVDSGHY